MSKKTENKNNSLNIIFDIRNSSVGISIWKKIKNIPTIIYTDREYILYKDIQDSTIFVENMYKTIDQIISRIPKNRLDSKNNLRHVDNILCVFSHPWYKSNIKNINIAEKRKRKFNSKYLEDKLEKNSNSKIEKNQIKIEDKIFSIYLNGYEVNDPENKEFKEVKISSYESVMSKETKREISNKIKNNFEYKNLYFNTHPLAITSVLRNSFHSLDNFSLFNIGGEATEILNFNEGSIRNIKILPNGFNFLIRELSKQIKEDKNTTFSKIKLLADKELKDEKIENEILKISKDLFSSDNQNKEEKINQNIFIIIDKDFSQIMKKIFKNREIYKDIFGLNKEPITRIVNSENTKNLAVYADGVERDPVLSTLFNFQQLILDKIC